VLDLLFLSFSFLVHFVLCWGGRTLDDGDDGDDAFR
jgi:hypothetical protein